eukprot:7728389-Ditylum_brightwellii.AAC.1
MMDGSKLATAQLSRELGEFPPLPPPTKANPLSNHNGLNRDIGWCCSCTTQSTCSTNHYLCKVANQLCTSCSCSNCCVRKSSGNPLNTIQPSNGNANVGPGLSSKGVKEAGEDASSQSAPPGFVFSDDPLLLKDLLSPVDCKLIAVYGHTIHDNDGSHMNGGILYDGKWQAYWATLTALPSQLYDVPS